MSQKRSAKSPSRIPVPQTGASAAVGRFTEAHPPEASPYFRRGAISPDITNMRALTALTQPQPTPTPSPPSENSRKRPASPSPSPFKPNRGTRPMAIVKFQKLKNLAQEEVRTRDKQVTGATPTPLAMASYTTRIVNNHNAAAYNFTPWVDKYKPDTISSLFVHKNKVEEVKNLVRAAYNQTSDSNKHAKVCLLSGPAGCGKTATVRLVAKCLDIEVVEWINPMSLSQFPSGGIELSGFRDGEVVGPSQLDAFSDFLFRTSFYKSLPFKGNTTHKHKMILVEDLPNIFYKDPKLFHSVLRKYMNVGPVLLVFVFTDSSSREHSLYKMFPKLLLTELGIPTISFNPVASSLLTKYLMGICESERLPIDRSKVQTFAEMANGDMRCAINNLQFHLTQQCESRRAEKPSNRSKPNFRKPSTAVAVSSGVHQKDDSIQLFRALGKVLYAKRNEAIISQVETESVRIESQRRIHPLIENPEEICNKMEVSADTFLSFLHQNYPPFFGSIDDMASAAKFLSESDFILSGWKFDDSGTRSFKARDEKDQLSMSTAIRALMFTNQNRVSVGWKPLTKPTASNLDTIIRNKIEDTRNALPPEMRNMQTSLFTDTIPFCSKLILNRAFTPSSGQKEILEMGTVRDNRYGSVPLDEKEVVDDVNECEAGDNTEMQEGGTITKKEEAKKSSNPEVVIDDEVLPEEDYEIEEFSD